jgi:hypothetical protein
MAVTTTVFVYFSRTSVIVQGKVLEVKISLTIARAVPKNSLYLNNRMSG